MQPRERLTAKEMQVALLSVARSHKPRDRPGHRDDGAGSKELSAEHI